MSDSQEKRLTFKLLGDNTQLKKSFNEVEKSGVNLKQTFTRVATAMASAFAIKAVVGFATEIGKVGAEFEQQMAKVRAISGASEEDLKRLEAEAKRLGSTTKFSAKQAGEGLEYFAMAGWSVDDSIKALEPTLKLATASGEDLGLVADIVSDAITAFGMTAEDASGFTDLLASTSSSANTNVSMLGESFKYVAPVMGALGASADDTALALGLMANAGIKGSQAGTAMRSAITNLVDPTAQMNEAMQKYGVQAQYNADGSLNLKGTMDNLRKTLGALTPEQQAQAGATIFGKEAMSGMLAIVNATEADYQKLTEATSDYNGVAQQQADIMGNTLEGRITSLKSAWEGVQLMLYQYLLPVFELVVLSLQTLIEWVMQFEQSIRENFQLSGEVVGAFQEWFAEVKELVLEIFNKMMEGVKKWYEANKERVDAVMEKFKVFAQVIGDIIKLVLEIFGWFVDMFTYLFLDIALAIIDRFLSHFKMIADVIRGVLMIVKGLFTGDWAMMWQGMQNIVTGILEAIVAKFQFMIDKIMAGINAIKNAYDSVKNIGSSIGEGVKNAGANLKSKIPFLAEGGVVTKPTLAMIGEGNESEAVIPLSKLNQFGSGGGKSANIIVELDGHTIARAIGEPLVESLRVQTGKALY